MPPKSSSHTDHPAPDPKLFRKAFSRNITGVSVVTSVYEEVYHGMTCNSYCSVSLHPPTLLVSLTKGSRTQQLIEQSKHFVFNLLSSHQGILAERFAGRHEKENQERFFGISWEKGLLDMPVLLDALASMECEVEKSMEVGDHVLYVGKVLKLHINESEFPLAYFDSRFLKTQFFAEDGV